MSARSQTVPQKAARASSRSSTGAQRRGPALICRKNSARTATTQGGRRELAVLGYFLEEVDGGRLFAVEVLYVITAALQVVELPEHRFGRWLGQVDK